MHLHELHNILDDASKIRPWLENMPGESGKKLIDRHSEALEGIARGVTQSTAPYAARTAISRVNEVAANIDLLYELVSLQQKYELKQLDEVVLQYKELGTLEGEMFDRLSSEYMEQSRKFDAAREARKHLQEQVTEIASYAEFLSLDARHHIGPAKTETMQRITRNPLLMRPTQIDEFRAWRNNKPHDATITHQAVATTQELRQALTEFEAYLGEHDDGGPGQAFARTTMLPRLRHDLDMLDASLDYLGTEIAELIRTSPNRQPVFENVQTNQAVPIELLNARAAALNDPRSNVVDLFSGRKGKG